MHPSLSLRTALVVLISMSMLACAPGTAPSAARDFVREIADQMAQASFVRSVQVRVDLGDDAVIDVSAKPGASVAEARDLVCRLFVPALRSSELPPSTGVEIWASDGGAMLADESSCG